MIKQLVLAFGIAMIALQNAFGQAAERIPPAEEQACIAAPSFECALQMASRDTDSISTAAESIIAALAARGLFDEARERAARLKNPYRREAVLTGIAGALQLQGRFAEAAEILAALPEGQTPGTKVLKHWWLVEAIVRAGRFAEGATIARAFADPASRALGLVQIAVAAKDPSLLSEAEALLPALNDVAERALVLLAIGNERNDTAMMGRGRLESRSIAKSFHVEMLVTRLVGLGLLAEAQTVALAMREPKERERVMAVIVHALAKAGRIDEARSLALGLTLPMSRIHALTRLAAATADAAHFREAIALSGSLPAEFATLRGAVLFQIGEEQIKAKLFREAIETARLVRAAGWPGDVMQTRGMLNHEAMYLILMARAGEGLGDRAIFAEFKAWANGQSIPPFRDMYLLIVVQHEAAAGFVDDAAATASSIQDPVRRQQVTTFLVFGLTKAGRFSEALRFARGIPDNNSRAQLTTRVAAGLPR